jgi:hypothetical protein
MKIEKDVFDKVRTSAGLASWEGGDGQVRGVACCCKSSKIAIKGYIRCDKAERKKAR